MPGDACARPLPCGLSPHSVRTDERMTVVDFFVTALRRCEAPKLRVFCSHSLVAAMGKKCPETCAQRYSRNHAIICKDSGVKLLSRGLLSLQQNVCSGNALSQKLLHRVLTIIYAILN